MTECTLLIDGDVIAFTAACAVQRIYEDEFGFVQPFASRHEGEAVVDNILIGLELGFKSTHRRIALSDPKANFRKSIWPGYKANRKDSVRPLLLDILKDYLRERYAAFHWPALEADDVLGILSTEPQAYPGQRILCGKDKDFKTVPGYYHRLKDLKADGSPNVTHITEWQAQMFHLWQTLAGDMTDGYPGCPGIGKTRASAILENPIRLMPSMTTITRGVNKGKLVKAWKAEPTTDLWACVVSHYQKGISAAGTADADWNTAEQAALTTARLAHILQHGDYEPVEEGAYRISPWSPERIKTQ
jgi:DNA polymerase-1